MHELSIANSVVEIASEHAISADAERIKTITLRIGALSCVHPDALEFSFELITKDTMLEGAKLEIIHVPLTVFCIPCNQEVELPGIQSFRCPLCDTPSPDVRKGKELDIDSIEIIEKNQIEVSQDT